MLWPVFDRFLDRTNKAVAVAPHPVHHGLPVYDGFGIAETYNLGVVPCMRGFWSSDQKLGTHASNTGASLTIWAIFNEKDVICGLGGFTIGAHTRTARADDCNFGPRLFYGHLRENFHAS